MSAVAFTTILAVTAGLVISASGAVAHDIWTNVVRGGHGDEREEPMVGRIAAATIGVLAIIIGILVGDGFNVSFLTSTALSVAVSANFPALLLALSWRRFTTLGAVVGVLSGLISAVVLIALSPKVWPGPDSEGSPFPLEFPALISLPLGFLGCWLGTMLSRREDTERSFSELRVRAETGLGAETTTAPRIRAREEVAIP